MFRKLFAILLCLLLILCVGCSDAEETSPPKAKADSTEPTSETEQPSDTEPSTEPTQPTEEPTEPNVTEEVFAPIDPDTPVIEAYTASDSDKYTTYTCSLPLIQCESSYAQAVNQEITDLYERYSYEDSWSGGNKSFDWYVNGNVLSVVIYHYDKESPSDYEVDLPHTIYNLRMSDGSKVTYDEILALAEVTKDDFRARAQQILGNFYIVENLLPEEAKAIYEKLLANPETSEEMWQYEYFCKVVSDENLDLVEVFLGENGSLHLTGRAYYVAGGFEYCTPLFDYFADFEVSPYFDTYFASVP